MNLFESCLLSYLVNSLWQIPLLFAAAWLVARLLRSAGPLVEHRIWVAALLLESLLPALPASWLAGLRALSLWPHRAHLPAGEHITVQIAAGTGTGTLHLPPWLLSSISALYLTAVVYLTARLLWRAGRLSALRRAATPVDLSGEAALCWQRSLRNLAVTNTTLAQTSGIFGPITIGLRRRLVLLPSGMLGVLSAEDLHTVIAHEFAHIRRHDFLKNLLYEAVTLPARYHPVLWLTREHVIETREMVCDRIAANTAGHREYARSLLRLASLLVHGNQLRTPHAIGIFDANTFERRLMRLTGNQHSIHGLRRVATITACLALGIATCCSALALRVSIGSDAAKSGKPSNDAATPVPSGVMAGNILTLVNPVYPEAAKKAKIRGAVVLHAIIGKDGAIEELRVLSGPDQLRASSIDAVHQWIYKPYLLNGEPVEVETTITVNYSLNP